MARTRTKYRAVSGYRWNRADVHIALMLFCAWSIYATPSASEEPEIVVIQQNLEGLALSIAWPASISGTVWEIHSVDLDPSAPTTVSEVDPVWSLAETNLALQGAEPIVWLDSGQLGRALPSAVKQRLYSFIMNGEHTLSPPESVGGIKVLSRPGISRSQRMAERAAAEATASRTEALDIGSRRNGTVLYVKASIGDNALDGYAPARLGDNGPKANTWAANEVVRDGDTIEIEAGSYHELPLRFTSGVVVLKPMGRVVWSPSR